MFSNHFWSRLRRYPRAGYVGGVCAGVAAYYDWNVRLIRIVLALALFFTGFFPLIFVYALMWYLMESDEGQPQSPSAAAAAPAAGAVPAGELRARFARMEDRLRSMETCVASRDYELRRELRKLES